MTHWVCDTCGNEGETRPEQSVDEVQCEMCGEPVTPLD
jgi:DNA-directed RNA polymerase subunit RPC12/RpoP